MTSTRSRRPRALTLLAGGLAAGALALTGCSNGLETTATGAEPADGSPSVGISASAPEPSTSAGPETPEPSTSAPGSADSPDPPSAAPQPSSRPSTSASPTSAPSTGPASASRCRTDQLQIGVRRSEGGAAAGSDYVLLTFRSTADATCVLTGFPGVSFVGHRDGTQLGVPAVRNRSAASAPVRLAPGRTTTSLLQVVNAGSFDADRCAPTTSDGFRVYPPGSRASRYVPYETQACQRDPGGNPQLVVSPVGTAG